MSLQVRSRASTSDLFEEAGDLFEEGKGPFLGAVWKSSPSLPSGLRTFRARLRILVISTIDPKRPELALIGPHLETQ